MNPDQVFQLCNTTALFTWGFLIIAPRWKWTSRILVGVIVTLLACCYACYISQSLKADDFNNFGSLDGVTTLFTNPKAVLAGWIHYLAFDLMVGWFILFDSKRNQINRFLIIPCLLFTFMMGPIGLLLYLLLRWVSLRHYFVDFE